jgi:hypothetical protein
VRLAQMGPPAFGIGGRYNACLLHAGHVRPVLRCGLATFNQNRTSPVTEQAISPSRRRIIEDKRSASC